MRKNRNTKRKVLLFFMTVFMACFITGCGSNISEKNIRTDLESSLQDEYETENVKVETISIEKRDIDKENKDKYIWLSATVKLYESIEIDCNYMMEYHKYTEGGWQLEELREENVEKWNYHPTAGVNEEIIRKSFADQVIPLNDELADLSDAAYASRIVDMENELLEKILANEKIEKKSMLVVSHSFDDTIGFNILDPAEGTISELVINGQETGSDNKKDKVNVSMTLDYEMVQWDVTADIAYAFIEDSWIIDDITVSDYNIRYKEGYEYSMSEEDYKKDIIENGIMIGEQTLSVEATDFEDFQEVWVITEETGKIVARYFTYRIKGTFADYYGLSSLLYEYDSVEGWQLNKALSTVSANNIDITGSWSGYMTVNGNYPDLLLTIESCDEDGSIRGTLTFLPSEKDPDVTKGVQSFTGTIDSELDVYVKCERWVENGRYSRFYNALLSLYGVLDVNEDKLVGDDRYTEWEAVPEQ